MKPEMFEMVLQEILQHQKETNAINVDLINHIKSVLERLDKIDKKISVPTDAEKPELDEIRELIHNSSRLIKSAITAKPETIIHQRNFQLFPSFNIKEYYRVYGNLMKWVVLFGIVMLFIKLIRDLLEKHGML